MGMKNNVWILAFCLLTGSLGVVAQPTDTLREITVRVVDRKGKPVPKIIVQAASSTSAGITDRKGNHTLSGLQTGDSINVLLPQIGEVLVPVKEGVDVILLTLKSSRDESAINPGMNTIVDLGYGGTKLKNSTAAATVISDVQQAIRETGATTVGQLFDQKGVTRGRGGLVFLDGLPSSIDEVENGFFYQIETIIVDKIGASYGFRGSNGAIQFFTKRYVMMMSQ